MFDPSTTPRIYGVPPGADFPKVLVDGLLERMQNKPVEALARVQVFVNTRRMQRRIKDIFDTLSPRLLPKVRLITDLSVEGSLAGIAPTVSPLRRELDFAQLVSKLMDAQPNLAPRSALFPLAQSLANLAKEMQDEGVEPDALTGLNAEDQSGYWQSSLTFLQLIGEILNGPAESGLDQEGRQRRTVEALVRSWQITPPDEPIIVAGSTGSRGTTTLFMEAVAQLPQGAIVLPGFDDAMPARVWNTLDKALESEDHPQFRFKRIMDRFGIASSQVKPWTASAVAPQPERNRLVSLALRPAPVTDEWMIDGPKLGGIDLATKDMSLIEAPSKRLEASAIALVMRDAAERGEKVALITPDRQLTRQVVAALDRWRLTPDDSAGRPLPLTPPGRFLRQVAGFFGVPLTRLDLIAVLKHPLTHSGTERGTHLLHTRDFELFLRKGRAGRMSADAMQEWAGDNASRMAWVNWLLTVLGEAETLTHAPLADFVETHISLAEAIARGPVTEGSGGLWEKEAGAEARKWVDEMQRAAVQGGAFSAGEYQAYFNLILNRGEVREAVGSHPDVMIWGTLEARVQGADLTILAGLNEGSWPEVLQADPWLNRQMRQQAGLLLPERNIGLAAHDFQQAIGAKKVVLSRALRDGDAEAIPSRWLNRIVNFMSGLSEESADALKGMRARGSAWIALAETLEQPARAVAPAPRPSPRPPAASRPKRLSITEVQKLIRDPYAVYAKHVLCLAPLEPLTLTPDAQLRGTLIHRVLERFCSAPPEADTETAKAKLAALCEAEFARNVDTHTHRLLWKAAFLKHQDWFVEWDLERRHAQPIVGTEERGRFELPSLEFTLTGTLDRVERAADGTLEIFDYKTGHVPSDPEQRHFDKQLPLSALLAEMGGLETISATPVSRTGYISFNSTGTTPKPKERAEDHQTTLDELSKLIAAYSSEDQGFTSRRAMRETRVPSEYDHLARFGEWDESTAVCAEDVRPRC